MVPACLTERDIFAWDQQVAIQKWDGCEISYKSCCKRSIEGKTQAIKRHRSLSQYNNAYKCDFILKDMMQDNLK